MEPTTNHDPYWSCNLLQMDFKKMFSDSYLLQLLRHKGITSLLLGLGSIALSITLTLLLSRQESFISTWSEPLLPLYESIIDKIPLAFVLLIVLFLYLLSLITLTFLLVGMHQLPKMSQIIHEKDVDHFNNLRG